MPLICTAGYLKQIKQDSLTVKFKSAGLLIDLRNENGKTGKKSQRKRIQEKEIVEGILYYLFDESAALE
jgi:hypothetical protein